MKRLKKQSIIEKYNIDDLTQISRDIGSWISGGRCWFDNPDETVIKWMEMFPEYIYSGIAYRLLAFDKNEIYDYFNNINDSNYIITKTDLDNLSKQLININNDYVSWTKDSDLHDKFHDFYIDFNGDDYSLFSIKSNVNGFYITKFNDYLNKVLYNKSKEEYDKECLENDEVNYSDQDEVIAPIKNFDLYMINRNSIYNLIGLTLDSFIKKI